MWNTHKITHTHTELEKINSAQLKNIKSVNKNQGLQMLKMNDIKRKLRKFHLQYNKKE